MTTWNQIREGNVHVTDGAEGYWATMPADVTAQAALDLYMSTADYDGATKAVTVTATVLSGKHEGQMATARVEECERVISESDADAVVAVALAEDIAAEIAAKPINVRIDLETPDGARSFSIMLHKDGMYTLSHDAPGMSITMHITRDERDAIIKMMGEVK